MFTHISDVAVSHLDLKFSIYKYIDSTIDVFKSNLVFNQIYMYTLLDLK